MNEDLDLSKGMNGGVPLQALGASGEKQCGDMIKNLVVAIVKFNILVRLPWEDIKKSDKQLWSPEERLGMEM